jgi:hypothetical protein
MGFMMYNPEESRVYGLKKKKYGIIWVIFQIYPNIISGWWFQSRKKYESVGIIIPYIWKNKKCFKPPTRNDLRYLRPILEISYAHRHVLGIC